MIKDITKEECLQITLNSKDGLYILFLLGIAFVIVPKVTMKVCGRSLETRLAPVWQCEAPKKEGAKKEDQETNCNAQNVVVTTNSCLGVVEEAMETTSV